jgi:hypothetical protein
MGKRLRWGVVLLPLLGTIGITMECGCGGSTASGGPSDAAAGPSDASGQGDTNPSGPDAGVESGAESGAGDPKAACLANRSAAFAEYARCFGVSAAVIQYTYYASESGDYYCSQVAAAVAAHKVTFDGSQLDACVAGLAAQACNDGSYPAACGNLFLGTVPDGGPCNDAIECSGSSVCIGSTCPGMCGAGVGVGGDCTVNPCALGLNCIYNTTTSTTNCQTVLKSGAPCNPAADACDYGLYCDSMTSHCLAQRTSGPCTGNECAAGYVCTTAGQCQKGKAEGQSCTAGQNECASGLYCSGGMCAEWPQISGTCGTLTSGETAGCQTGCCTAAGGSGMSGTCAQPGMSGGACNYYGAATGCGACPDGNTCNASGDAGVCAVTSCY